MSDLIDRDAAIDVINAVFPVDSMKSEYAQGITCSAALAKTYVEQLPSAQPEIIRCRDCKYKDDGIDEDGIPFLKCLNGRSYGGTRINDYCSWAERRQIK